MNLEKIARPDDWVEACVSCGKQVLVTVSSVVITDKSLRSIFCNMECASRKDFQELGVKCGKCGGEIKFQTCPTHFWVLASECLSCGEIYVVNEKCKECDYTFF